MWENNPGINIRGIGRGGLDWPNLALDMDQWWALVKTAINLQVP
jgi:hypothetical protein